MTSTFWTPIGAPNSPIGRYNPLWLSIYPTSPPSTHTLIRAIHDITVDVKIVAQNPPVLAMYT